MYLLFFVVPVEIFRVFFVLNRCKIFAPEFYEGNRRTDRQTVM